MDIGRKVRLSEGYSGWGWRQKQRSEYASHSGIIVTWQVIVINGDIRRTVLGKLWNQKSLLEWVEWWKGWKEKKTIAEVEYENYRTLRKKKKKTNTNSMLQSLTLFLRTLSSTVFSYLICAMWLCLYLCIWTIFS